MSSNGYKNEMEKGAEVQQENYSPNSNEPMSYTPYPSKLGNPGPAGLFSFASTTLILSLYNVNARGIHTPNVVVGMTIFTGGILQFIAGMWEFPRGNTFGASVFSSFGAFWMSYAAIFIPGSGIQAAYSDPKEFNNAIGIYLLIWAIVTFLFLIVIIRRHVAISVLLTFLFLTFVLLAAGAWTGMTSVNKAGGVCGIISASSAYYIGVSDLLAEEKRAIIRIPVGVLHD
jgi:succinate-acetate transporter protein